MMQTTTWPQLILFGDSHFQLGFSQDSTIASLLADKLQRRVDVINRGFSGYNVRLAKLALPRIFPEQTLTNVAGVVVGFGSNDTAVESADKWCQYVPVEDYKKDLNDIIAFFMVHGVPKERIVLYSAPPVDEEAWDKACQVNRYEPTRRSSKNLENYALAAEEVAKSQGIWFLDLYQRFTIDKEKWRSYFYDGLHMNGTGSALFMENLWPILDSMLKSYPIILPDWTDVDFRNPGAYF